MNKFSLYFVLAQNSKFKKTLLNPTVLSNTRVLLLGILFISSSQLAVAQLDCSSAVNININTLYNGNTTGANSDISTYNNDAWWQLTGPEVVHEFDWPGGDVSIQLTNKMAALDLILLRSCDNNDFISSGGGNSGIENSSIERDIPSGTYLIIVDGWQESAGGYDLIVTKSTEVSLFINGAFRRYLLDKGSVFDLINGNWEFLTDNVESMEKNWGYVTDSNSGNGKDEGVLSIIKVGEVKPRMLLNGNFETFYYKQKLNCPQKTLSLYGEFVYNGNEQILTNCDLLRCENGHTLSHQRDGQIKLYDPSSNNLWLDINQIITIDGFSYFVRGDDNTVWKLEKGTSDASMIGSNAKLLQDNDNELIKIDNQGNYMRWDGQQWSNLTPNYVDVSPEMIDEGFWFFIQAKPLLDSGANVDIDHKRGLTYNANGSLTMDLIPSDGNCEEFLWRTKKNGSGKRFLINKAKGTNNPLQMTQDGTITFENGMGVEEWDITNADINRYGTNAYHLVGANAAKALSYDNGVQSNNPSAGNNSQTWVLQFNQMVRDYFLPIPTKSILETHYTANPNFNHEEDATKVLKDYNKFLKGDYEVTFFSTNTGTDWALVNYYFTINNMMNAVVKPKPSDPLVDPNLVKTIDVLAGQSLVLINKNDLNSVVPTQYFLQDFNTFSVASLRGSSGYNSPFKWILTSEELTCKTGIVNRPHDKDLRKYDHGVHEFAHAMQELPNWISIIDANNMCPNEIGRSSECFCWDIQYWFNSGGTANTYPGFRAFSEQRMHLMEKFFKKENTWMPPKILRADGYTPSGPTIDIMTSSVKDFDNNVKVTASPNPFLNSVSLSVESNTPQPLSITFTDVSGKVLKKMDIQNKSSNHQITVNDIEAKGVIIVLVKGDDFSETLRLIKL